MLINLSRVKDVKTFVEIAQSCTGELTLKSQDGKYAVDAKSILGIFSLDLSNKVVLEGSEDNLNKFTAFQF